MCVPCMTRMYHNTRYLVKHRRDANTEYTTEESIKYCLTHALSQQLIQQICRAEEHTETAHCQQEVLIKHETDITMLIKHMEQTNVDYETSFTASWGSTGAASSSRN